MKLKYAIFDLDGTVLDSLPVWETVGLDTLRAQGYDPDPQLNRELRTLTMADGAKLCKELFSMPESVDEIVQMVEDQVLCAYNQSIPPKAGADGFLRRLKAAGIRMCIATSTQRYLVEAGLRRNGLLEFFDGIFTCPEVGQGKKEGPAVYEAALRRMGGTKEEAVVFEDALHAIHTAKAAGFRVAAIYDIASEGEHEEIRALSDFYFHHYDEIPVEI